MTLKQFIAVYDFPSSVVLLEGKRDVPTSEKNNLIALGRLLADNTANILFRSGNASGTDEYFSQGVSEIDPKRLQVITPYSGHRKKQNKAYSSISLDEVNLMNEPEVIYQSKKNKKTEKLIDRYVDGNKDRYSIKAAYIIRDTIKVIGAEQIKPANFAIFYDDLEKPMTGGTGHKMNICKQNGINFIDQRFWTNWIHRFFY